MVQSWCVQCVQYVYDPNARILNFKTVGGGTTKRNEMEEEPLLPLPRHLREANDDGDRPGGDDRIHEDVDADDGGAGEGAGEGEGAGLWEERGNGLDDQGPPGQRDPPPQPAQPAQPAPAKYSFATRYFSVSMLLAVGMVYYALQSYQQFYPAVGT